MAYLKVADKSLDTLLFILRLSPAELSPLVIPDALLHAVHEPSLLELVLAHTRGDHQHLEVGILLIRKSGDVKANLNKKRDKL